MSRVTKNPYQWDIEKLQLLATQVRRDIIRMVYEAQSGHPGGSLGCTEFMVALYFHVLRYDPYRFQMDGMGEDVFILSNGHISPVYYSVLARSGYFPLQELTTFRRINSRLQGHPATKEGLPGVRIATGSLGQGLSVALGIALGKRLAKDPYFVYVLIGDGEAQEGQIWEAAQFAAHHAIDNVIVTMDWNYKQIDGDTREVMHPKDMEGKWRSFGWEVLRLNEGNDINAVLSTLHKARNLTGKGKPVIILMNTIMGKGVDFMEDDYRWHGKPPNKEQFERAMAQLPETLGDY